MISRSDLLDETPQKPHPPSRCPSFFFICCCWCFWRKPLSSENTKKPSGRLRGPIRLTYPTYLPEGYSEEKGEGPSVPPLGSSPDLSSRGPSQTAEERDEESRPKGGALGWSLRSRVEIKEGRRKKRKVDLWVSLSREEIEEDFPWMTSVKPPHRSRRRSKLASD